MMLQYPPVDNLSTASQVKQGAPNGNWNRLQLGETDGPQSQGMKDEATIEMDEYFPFYLSV